MEDKYNTLSLEQYSRNLAKLLCDRYFANHETINGQQLITFSPVKQINLFVIKELLISWNREMANLKSPYFDFEDEEVKAGLKQFMNVLSRKILIRRPHFEPLLQKAILDAFTLVLQPATSFDEKFLQVQEEVTPAKLQEHLKYLDLNKTHFSEFLQSLPPQTLDKTAVLQKFRLYSQAHYRDLAPVEALLEQLNPLLPISKQDILEKAAAPVFTPASPAPEKTTFNTAPEPASGPMYNIPAADTNAVFEKAAVPASGPTGPASFPKPEPTETAQPVAQPVPAPAASMPAVTTATPAPADQPDVKLYEKFKTEKPTLNETLKKPEAPNLAEKDTRKIETLKESISINQRFSFINELFNGENLEYYEAIQILDAKPDAESAKRFLLEDLAAKHNWVKKEEHLNKLLRLIERKFA
ncbi:hypothetical protein I5M27_16130 [Adhaeribacter sp. BT258]|uniref:Uncharacterized protein n=1 Tax=Adhaeribacter terrigena TaxID=2793070 RepID=A0ABS1C5N5_9BACT|nr:hypothetical protein [Adhaeribacter terrigena]MBK0404526.1 hypothetical protein [Adhaeribacter terrigena]